MEESLQARGENVFAYHSPLSYNKIVVKSYAVLKPRKLMFCWVSLALYNTHGSVVHSALTLRNFLKMQPDAREEKALRLIYIIPP